MQSHPKGYTQAGTRVDVHLHSGQMPQCRLPTRQGHRSPGQTTGQTLLLLCPRGNPCPDPPRPILSDTNRLPSPWKPPSHCRYRTQHHRSLPSIAICPFFLPNSAPPPSLMPLPTLTCPRPPSRPWWPTLRPVPLKKSSASQNVSMGALMRPRPTFPCYTRETGPGRRDLPTSPQECG